MRASRGRPVQRRTSRTLLSVNQAARDQDRDKLDNLHEYKLHLDPRDADTDNDGVRDGREDADHDGTSNATEQRQDREDEQADGDGQGGDQTPGEGDGGEHPGSPWDHVVGLEAGALTIAHADGTTVTARFGDGTQLLCGAHLPGPFSPCGAGRLVAGARVVVAQHDDGDGGVDRWTRVLLLGDAPGAGGSDSPTPELAAAPPVTGTVASFNADTHVLTVHRPSGEEPSGPLADGIEVHCLTISGGHVVSNVVCDAAQALVPGAKLGMSTRSLIEGQWRWVHVDVLIDGGSDG